MMGKSFKNSKDKLSRFAWFLGEHAFSAFLVLVSLALIWGGFLFYQYSILIKTAEPEVQEGQLQFQEDLYQEILEEWQDRQESFGQAELKEYLDPFNGLTE